ncbi:hypothetical protein D5086_017931 [Populus alba]|uniref:Uncharacterized protein n=1 Tax=Populus alba TaxID=43335 RepID=A0ACC4BPJ4_POPAL
MVPTSFRPPLSVCPCTSKKEKNGMLDLLSSVWLEEYYHSGNRGERLGDGPPRGPSVVCEAFHIISAQAHLPYEVIAWAGQALGETWA